MEEDKTAAVVFQEIREDIDPEQKHDLHSFTAALLSLGLTLDDVELSSQPISLHARVPAKNQEAIKKQRNEVWDGLRQQRLREVQCVLEGMKHHDKRRFNTVDSEGVRPIDWSHDLPPAEALDGMDDFMGKMEEKQRQQKKDQQRKATKLAMDFLMEKKRLDDAEKADAEFEARMKEKQKEQDAAIKAKRAESEKAADRRAQMVARAAQEQADREDEMEAKMNEKMKNARARRAKNYSTEKMAAKADVSQAKRDYCYYQAVEQEERTLNELERKRAALTKRLDQRDRDLEEQRRLNREAAAQKSFQTQVKVQAHWEKWAENKVNAHKAFSDRFDGNRANNTQFLKERSKSTGDITKKAIEKWRARAKQLNEQQNASNDELMMRHENARKRCEANAELRLKCDNDVFSFREVKDKTWGELTHKRQDEYKRSRDSNTQALLFRIAEQMSAADMQAKMKKDLWDRRQIINRELLIQKEKAEEAFIKIACEPDMNKVAKTMNNLGFELPSLPAVKGKGGEEDESKAF